MATQSFYQDIVLKTKEEVDRLVEAFDEADRRGPIDTSNAHEVVSDPKRIDEILRGIKNESSIRSEAGRSFRSTA